MGIPTDLDFEVRKPKPSFGRPLIEGGVVMGLHNNTHGVTLAITLRPAVLDALRLSYGDRVEVAHAQYSGVGYIRIRPTDDSGAGYKISRSGRTRSAIVRIGAPKGVTASPQRGKPCEHKVSGGELIAQVPFGMNRPVFEIMTRHTNTAVASNGHGSRDFGAPHVAAE